MPATQEKPVAAATIAQVLSSTTLDLVDARALLRHVLGRSDAYLIAHRDDSIPPAQVEVFQRLSLRRASGVPIAYLTGRREFFSLEFKVTPAVLIPRPETELLVEFALERVSPGYATRVLDLGTGSGCVAVAIATHRPQAQVTAIDHSTAALAVAAENACVHNAAQLQLIESDWFSALAGQRFDVIVANPPYVAVGEAHLREGDLRSEPQGALVGGADGLESIRIIVAAAPHYLASGGWLAFEHGYAQRRSAHALLAAAGFSEVFSRRDLAGIERISGGRLPAELDGSLAED